MTRLCFAAAVLSLVALTLPLPAQQGGCGHGAGKGQGKGMGHGAGMRANDPNHATDRDMIHFLIDQREKISRSVTKLDDGVETLTESDDPEVAQKIRSHVASMKQRVADSSPIHQRDPLFVEIFKHADKIEIAEEPTTKGIKVRETSKDPNVARLIQAHASVIDKFLENGRSEMHADHAIPGAVTPR